MSISTDVQISYLQIKSEIWAPVTFNPHHLLDCLWNQVQKKKNFGLLLWEGFQKERLTLNVCDSSTELGSMTE